MYYFIYVYNIDSSAMLPWSARAMGTPHNSTGQRPARDALVRFGFPGGLLLTNDPRSSRMGPYQTVGAKSVLGSF